MIVTQITEISKNRFKVYIDQEFAFVLYKGELHMYHFSEGSEVDEGTYNNIMNIVLLKRAKLRAMNLLQKRTYTEKQLKDKLMEGFYPEVIIENTITYVKSFHYVNDEQYALDYLTYNEGKKSLRQIELDLYRKGITKDIFRQSYLKWQENGGRQDEQEMIRTLLEKKKYSVDSDFKEKQRIFGYLLRKGYSSDMIKKVMCLEDNQMCKQYKNHVQN